MSLEAPSETFEIPLVEIVTPAYKAELTIAETIESVRAQTLDSWRLWIIDDGSPDGTSAVVESYLSDPRIHLLRQENRGAAHARNYGLEQCRGKYIAFLDADDCWEPRFLETLAAKLDKDPKAGLAWSEMVVFGDTEGPYRCGRPPVQGDPPSTLNEIYMNVTFLPSCTLFRATLFQEGLRWEQDCSPMEDMPIFLAVASQSRVVYVDQVLSRYRNHAGSATTSPGAVGRNYRSMVHAFRTIFRRHRSAIPYASYRSRMWWIHHHAADSLLVAGRPSLLLFLKALWYQPQAATTWKTLVKGFLKRLSGSA